MLHNFFDIKESYQIKENQSVSLNSKMKTLVAFLGLLALAAAQEPESCAVCRERSGALFAALNSEESIARQIEYIVNEGCPLDEDPEGCADAITTWWARMAFAIYTEGAAAWTCNVLDPACELPTFVKEDWDCDTCVAFVQSFSGVGLMEETGAAIVATLQGPAFCQAEDLMLDADQVAACQEDVKTTPAAFNMVFAAVGEMARDICVDLYQACDAKKKLF